MDLIALPAPPVTVVELPVPAVVEINLPVVAVSVLPVGFIPMVPEHTTFMASGSGSASVAAKPTTRAAATGVGAAPSSPSLERADLSHPSDWSSYALTSRDIDGDGDIRSSRLPDQWR